MTHRITLFLTVAALAAAIAFAQEFRGTITGRITDPQSAAIAAAKISATQIETGAKTQTVSSSDGQFTLPFLPPGTYSVSAEVPGFKRFVREGLRVSTNERLSLDIELEVGQVSDSVTVSAESPLLSTSTASTGQVINERQIENMPMNGRTPLVLAQLSFGVIPNNDPRFYRPFDDGGPSGFSIGGAPNRSNEILLDGTPDASVGNGLGFSPPVDSVEEVKVETFQADAAYGHSGGGTVNMVTKAGTNTFHGTAYDFNQVSALAPRCSSPTAPGRRRTSRITTSGDSRPAARSLCRSWSTGATACSSSSPTRASTRSCRARPRQPFPQRPNATAISPRCWLWARTTRSTIPRRARERAAACGASLSPAT